MARACGSGRKGAAEPIIRSLPDTVVAKLHAAMLKVMETSAVLAKLRDLGTEPGSSSPEEFRKLIQDELNNWRNVARSAGLKFE